MAYSITPNPATVNEADGTITFTVTRTGVFPAETIYVSTVQTEGFSNNGDYIGKLNEPLVFSAGQTSRTVTVSIVNDSGIEVDETFGLIVQRNQTDPVSTFLAKTTFTIEDNDAPQNTTYTLTPSPTTVTEGNQVTFTITRSGDKPAETVWFSTLSDGSATYAEGDYTTTSGGSPANIAVNFSSGETSETVTLDIVNDGVSDSGEQFRAIVQRNSSDPVSTYLDRSSFVTINDPVAPTTDAIANHVGTAATLTAGGSVIGTIEQYDLGGNVVDADYYRVTLTGGHRYIFDATGRATTIGVWRPRPGRSI